MSISDRNANNRLTHPKYRPDIDGLRAVAVLSVVGFHAFPFWVKGGFVGVDIFFVISGYLISIIILGNLKTNTFSFIEFYIRRIKRIFPALIAVLIISFTAGWIILLQDEYKQFGKHLAGGVAFISNFVLWRESGYFDNSAETKPLLHLWSLGIEEQFYIVWPPLLFAASKFRLNLLTITIIVSFVSFYFNVNEVSKYLTAAFYLPHYRFWELLTGALLAWLAVNRKKFLADSALRFDRLLDLILFENIVPANGKTLRDLASIIGFVLIALSIFGISREYKFPGWWALAPTLGTCMVIWAGPYAIANRRILSNKAFVSVGLISYPLYLWHWPILSFLRIVTGENPTGEVRFSAVIISIILAWATYKFIERPVRASKDSLILALTLAVAIMTIGFVGYATYLRNGFAFRMQNKSEFVAYFENELPNMAYYERLNLFNLWKSECAYFDAQKYIAGTLEGGITDSKPRPELDSSCYTRDYSFEKSVLLWGDSHAQALSPGLQKHLPNNYQLLQIATSGCRPDINRNTPSNQSQCKQSNYLALKTIQEAKPDVVIIAHAIVHYALSSDELAQIVDVLGQFGIKRVLVVGPTPSWKSDLPKLLARSRLGMPLRLKSGLNGEVIDINQKLKDELNKIRGVEYIDLISLFCNDNGCLTHIGNDVKTGITTWDYGHLTPAASEFVAEKLLVKSLILDN